MAQPFVGEIRMFAGNFPPNGWLFCEGQVLPISENDVLFQLIGTTYGGDGEETFALPDLRGRIPVHMGQGAGISDRMIGEAGGEEQVTLATHQIPAHSHLMVVSEAIANLSSPANAMLGVSSQATVFFGDPPGNTTMHPATIEARGGSQPHSNVQPYLCINFIISLFGVFPSQG